jgi:hypothetical protein
MKLTFRKHEVKDLSQLQALVADNPEAVEPGFRVIATGVNFGRSTVELVGLDRRETPALIALGFTGDDAMLFRMVEAYGWSLEYPESVRRLVPGGSGACSWPPRVVFVAERLPESFLRKIRLLTFPAVNCFEYRCVEVNDATGFYLDAVDWTGSAPPPAPPPATPAAEPWHGDGVRHQAPAPPLRAAPAHAKPPAGDRAQPSRWFGLLTPPSETPAPERSPGRAEPAASLEASIVPIAEDPRATEPPRASASQPTASTDGPGLVDDHELAPAWRKFFEKLAGSLDPRPADGGPAAAPTEKTARAPEAETQPAVAYAPPSRNGGAKQREDPRQRALLDVVKLPVNGELAPQWRKFLENPALDEAKIAAVREYLHRDFPMCTIYDFYEHQQNAQVLQLQDNQGKVAHLATITLEFFAAHSDSDLRAVLEKLQLSQAMRQAGQAGVLVTPSGLDIQKR